MFALVFPGLVMSAMVALAETPATDLPVGWQWEAQPRELSNSARGGFQSWYVDSGILNVVRGAEGDVIVQHIALDHSPVSGDRYPRYEVHAMHEDGTRCAFRGKTGSGRNNLWIEQVTFAGDTDAHGPITQVGLAVLTLDGAREASKAALARAREHDASVLPLPVVGETYEYDLPTMDGKRVDHALLRGKVVLIDCWATWCGPCMAKMPELAELHEKYESQGLVIIGINFDDAEDVARKAIDENALPWQNVHAPGAAKNDDTLWEQASGISTLPRLLLIDRDGTLIDDFYPHNLAERIAKVMQRDDS